MALPPKAETWLRTIEYTSLMNHWTKLQRWDNIFFDVLAILGHCFVKMNIHVPAQTTNFPEAWSFSDEKEIKVAKVFVNFSPRHVGQRSQNYGLAVGPTWINLRGNNKQMKTIRQRLIWCALEIHDRLLTKKLDPLKGRWLWFVPLKPAKWKVMRWTDANMIAIKTSFIKNTWVKREVQIMFTLLPFDSWPMVLPSWEKEMAVPVGGKQ